MPLYFNASNQFIPLLNLCPLLFGLTCFSWLSLVCWLLVSNGNVIFWFIPNFSGAQLGHKTRPWCVYFLMWDFWVWWWLLFWVWYTGLWNSHLIARQEHIGGLLVSAYEMTLSQLRRPKSGFTFLFIGNRFKHKAAYWGWTLRSDTNKIGFARQFRNIAKQLKEKCSDWWWIQKEWQIVPGWYCAWSQNKVTKKYWEWREERRNISTW